VARDFKTVGVVGLGTMGAGIAEVLARSGVRVYGVELDPAALDRGRGHLRGSTQRAVSRGKLSEQDAAALLERVTFTTDFADLAAVDLVIEAIPERIEFKRDLFQRLDAICGPETVFATNTSSLSVTEIAASTSRPGRLVGVHFFNPAPVMKLVEIVRTVVTEPEVVADVEALATRLGKSPVVIGDKAGFIANALLFGYLNHAATMFESRYASREDIDAAMRVGGGLPLGPFELLDLIGLDVSYQVLETMYKQSGDRLHAPAPIFKQMTTAGLLGRKSGRGFYTYEKPGSPALVPDELTPEDGARHAAPGRSIGRVAVLGSGATAEGIAEDCAASGLETVRIASSGSLADAADCDLIIEAEAEDLEVKKALFRELDGICKPGAVLATTTFSLPVIDCAMATARPQDVVGLHFLGPASTASLVEVVRTVATAPDVLTTAHELSARLGKQAVDCGDRAGFIVNALRFPYLNDAIKMLEAHYATADGIDTAMKLGCGYPKGPFELLDELGLDVALSLERALYQESREPGLAPAPLLEHLVTAGYLGRGSGRGFRGHAA
jgi:3-hydroxybutyryl-CoA dehydrogenase